MAGRPPTCWPRFSRSRWLIAPPGASSAIATSRAYPHPGTAQHHRRGGRRGGRRRSRTKEQGAAVLPPMSKALRLPSSNRNWKHLTDTADRDGWPAANLLASLLEIEMADRSSRRIQRHRDQSGLPAGKTFATFDFDAAPGIRKPHLLSLAAGDDWIETDRKSTRLNSSH